MTVVGSPESPLTLSAVAAGTRGRIDAIPQLWITAEVQKVNHSSAGVYITLADSTSSARPPTLTARVEAKLLHALPAPPIPGVTLVARVSLQYWPSSSSVSAQVHELALLGDGDLLAKIELLRRKLGNEGLFGDKKPLPLWPKSIGIVTAAGSAAHADVVARVAERWPPAQFVLVDTPMQGPSAVPGVCAALKQLDANSAVDVVVITRGGGSVQDLAIFSNETLLRAVAATKTPVVSAIGHDPDRPILDDVADMSVATPTHAAAVLVGDALAHDAALTTASTRMFTATQARLAAQWQALGAVATRPVLTSPTVVFDRHEQLLSATSQRLTAAVTRRLDLSTTRLDSSSKRLTALSPQATLERGYAFLRREDGTMVGPVESLLDATVLSVRVADGTFTTVVRRP